MKVACGSDLSLIWQFWAHSEVPGYGYLRLVYSVPEPASAALLLAAGLLMNGMRRALSKPE